MTRDELQRLFDRLMECTDLTRGSWSLADFLDAKDSLIIGVGEYLAQPDPTVEIAYLKAKLADVEAERNRLPGPLTWKWDGGRCAVLNADRRIVGYLQLGTWKCPSCGASGAES